MRTNLNILAKIISSDHGHDIAGGDIPAVAVVFPT